jgi:deoxyhypusine synthase
VDKDTYLQTTESMQSDYSVVMPFLMKALFDNRARYQEMAEQEGEESLFARQPKARGYLRAREGYRLFERRARLNAVLTEEVRNNREWLMESLAYPLAVKA